MPTLKIHQYVIADGEPDITEYVKLLIDSEVSIWRSYQLQFPNWTFEQIKNFVQSREIGYIGD